MRVVRLAVPDLVRCFRLSPLRWGGTKSMRKMRCRVEVAIDDCDKSLLFEMAVDNAGQSSFNICCECYVLE